MTPEVRRLHESPPTEEVVLAEIGRTVLCIQPTESFFNFIAGIVVHDAPFTVESLTVFSTDTRAKTLGSIKLRLEKDRINFDPGFLSSLGNFIENRNKLVHRAQDIPGWNLETSEGRIQIFCFLKSLQASNSELCKVLMGLAMEYDKKHFYNVFGKSVAEHGLLWPQAPFYQQVAKEVFGLKESEPSQEKGANPC